MAKERPQYEEVKEFQDLAVKVAEKYPHVFDVDVDKVCCVKVTNKERPETRKELHTTRPVRMPIRMHSPYSWYVTVYASDWDEMDKKHKLLLVSDVLFDIAIEEGKVNKPDIKGYGAMFRTFNTVDYMDSHEVPDILEEDVNWKI